MPEKKHMDTTFYLVLEKNERSYWPNLNQPKATKNFPTLKAGQVAVKVKLSIPVSAFEKAQYVANLELSEQDVIIETDVPIEVQEHTA